MARSGGRPPRWAYGISSTSSTRTRLPVAGGQVGAFVNDSINRAWPGSPCAAAAVPEGGRNRLDALAERAGYDLSPVSASWRVVRHYPEIFELLHQVEKHGAWVACSAARSSVRSRSWTWLA